ncbi:MAG: hypothetical protein IJY79_04565 [Clostridia bacterium]|nr:hypothetical protein [Clostridia bacterium]
MFVLKNKLGTAYIETKSELRRDDLINRGWTLVKKEENLKKMKKEELEKIAAEKGIDISNAKNNAERVAMIKAAN